MSSQPVVLRCRRDHSPIRPPAFSRRIGLGWTGERGEEQGDRGSAGTEAAQVGLMPVGSAWPLDRKAKILGGVRHPTVVGDDSSQVPSDELRGCKMDRIETSQLDVRG